MRQNIGTGEKSTRLLSVLEVQAELSVSRPTLQRLLERGSLKTVRIGRAVRIPRDSIIELIEKGGERHLVQENKQ